MGYYVGDERRGDAAKINISRPPAALISRAGGISKAGLTTLPTVLTGRYAYGSRT